MAYKPAELAAILRPFLLSDIAQVASAVSGAEGIAFDKPLLSRGDGTPLEEYDTLALALAAANSGNTIWLPPGIYGGDHTIPTGVRVVGFGRFSTQLTGQITLGGDNTVLHNISIPRTANDANTLVGVVGPASGTARMFNCGIRLTQSGAGNAYGVVDGGGTATLTNVTVNVANATGAAYAVYVASGGTINADDCELLAETGSAGYAAYLVDGNFYQRGGRAVGTVSMLPYYV